MSDTQANANPSSPWTPERMAALDAWRQQWTGCQGQTLGPLQLASEDASARRYWRFQAAGGEGSRSWIVMDCPPAALSVEPFVHIAQRMAQAQLPGPRVHAQDISQGFLLLDDLGDKTLLMDLQEQLQAGEPLQAIARMKQAASLLVQWQQRMSQQGLAAYDPAFIARELQLFVDWCVSAHFGVTWTEQQQKDWAKSCDLLSQAMLRGPTVCMHRDWMPRNLMVQGDSLSILDFQDAIAGPIQYDVASLLRDAFLSWPEDVEIDVCAHYWEKGRLTGLPLPEDFGEFWRAVEWAGLQRHLKVMGIFCRLALRDGKPRYVQDLPRFMAYAWKVASRYQGLGPLAHLLEPLMGMQRQEAFY